MANVVKNAKKAARDTVTAVVDKVKGLKKKDKPAVGPDVSPVLLGKKKDTSNPPDVSPAKPKGKKGKKPVDLSVPRNAVSKAIRKGLSKFVDADSCTTAKNLLGRGANRANVFGHSASAVWRALGFRYTKSDGFLYTLSDARAVRDALGLEGVITDTNVKCQFGDGRTRANKGMKPDDAGGTYGGVVAPLTDKDWTAVDKMVKAARDDS